MNSYASSFKGCLFKNKFCDTVLKRPPKLCRLRPIRRRVEERFIKRSTNYDEWLNQAIQETRAENSTFSFGLVFTALTPKCKVIRERDTKSLARHTPFFSTHPYRETQRPATTPGTSCPALFEKCVGSLTSHNDHIYEHGRYLWDGTYGLSSLSEKTWKSNHLLILITKAALSTQLF